jgi:hypothetical protein
MMFAMFNAVKGLVRNAGFLGKFRIRQSASFLPQIFRQLLVQVVSHLPKMAKMSSRMRDDLALQNVTAPARLEKYERTSWGNRES